MEPQASGTPLDALTLRRRALLRELARVERDMAVTEARLARLDERLSASEASDE